MKFALKIRKIYTISILACFVVIYNGNAQQFSYVSKKHVYSINRYTLPSQLGIEKIHSISQNNLGILFLSTNKGVIRFDGHNWAGVNFNKKAFLVNQSNHLYLFSEMFTGIISLQASGNYQVEELKVQYPLTNWSPEKIIGNGKEIIIQANKALWQFQNNHFQKLKNETGPSEILKSGDTIYFFTENETFRYYKNQMVSVSHLPDHWLEKAKDYHFSGLTRAEILEILNNSDPGNPGHFRAIENKNTQDNYIYDWNDNLWIISSGALFCLKNPTYFQQTVIFNHTPDSIQAFATDSSGIFIAEGNTLFTTDSKKNFTFPKPILQIANISDHMLVIGTNGIFEFKNQRNISLVNHPISHVTCFRDKLIFLSTGKLFSLRFINDKFTVKELIRINLDTIKRMISLPNEDLLILDIKNRIIRLRKNHQGYNSETIYDPGISLDAPAIDNIFSIRNDIYAYNSFEIFQLSGNKLIQQEWILNNINTKGGFLNYINVDSTGNLLISIAYTSQKREVYYAKKNLDNKYNWYEIPTWEAGLVYPHILAWNEKDITFYEKGKLYLFSLLHFFNSKQNITLSIDQVRVNDQKCDLTYRKKGTSLIPYFEKRYPVEMIRMRFQAVDLLNPEHVSYSFLLDNGEKEWSPWSTNPERTFFNLSPGDYKIKVKAKTLNGKESEVFYLNFKVFPPLYLEWYAWLLYGVLATGVIGFYGYRRKKQFEKEKVKLEKIIHERTAELIREKEKTDELLANMLPKDTAEELKSTGKASSHKFDMATVLFSDIQGFTKIAEQMNPEKLIDELDNFFFQFDSVVEKYNIEKIKTIGDAYMAAGGIPYKNRTNPVEVVLAALEMQEYMKTLKIKNSDIWDLRIGIHTGAVIAGVVGHKKISYDIWGDTVNTASRMESSGEASKINISGQTYEMVKEFFICEYRGKMPVKYKGDIDMYFVKGIRPELSLNLRSIPNRKFFIQLQLLRIQDLEESIFTRLETELPQNLIFHNLKHTKDVYTQVELLGRAENISPEEMLLVRTAALLHDTGYIYTYHCHEPKSIEVGREILPKYKYEPDQIEIICHLILCTQKNVKPANILEEILIDANTDYLGRIDFLEMSLHLFKELKNFNISKSEKDWLTIQAKRIDNHEYYTSTARKLREVPKREQIQKIQDYLKLNP